MSFVGRPDHHIVVLLTLEVLVYELFSLMLNAAAQDHLIKPFLVLLLERDLLDADLSSGKAIERVLLESLDLRLLGEITGMTWMHADVDRSNILCAG